MGQKAEKEAGYLAPVRPVGRRHAGCLVDLLADFGDSGLKPEGFIQAVGDLTE